jgi:hypothetical protein
VVGSPSPLQKKAINPRDSTGPASAPHSLEGGNQQTPFEEQHTFDEELLPPIYVTASIAHLVRILLIAPLRATTRVQIPHFAIIFCEVVPLKLVRTVLLVIKTCLGIDTITKINNSRIIAILLNLNPEI